jgi:ABC-type transport system involved in multi-copper enzyme maturation permease subunit
MPRPLLPELPILQKEIVGLLRTRRAFWFLVAAVAGSSLLSLIAWPSTVADTERAVAAAGTFLLAQLTAALAVVPAFAAGAISLERERGTYELLFATRLSPASIVLSKALASTGYVVILLIASAPGVILLHLLGGVTFGTILECQAVIAAAVALSALICLRASSRVESTSVAVTTAVVGVVFWNGGFCFLLLLGISLLRSYGSTSLDSAGRYAAVALSPHAAVAIEVFGWPDFFGAQTAAPARPWAVHVAAAAILSSCYLIRLLLCAGTPGIAASPRLLGPTRRPSRRPFLTALILAMERVGGPFGNPVFRKDIRSEFFGRIGYRRFVFWGLCALSGVVILGVEGFDEVEKEVTTIGTLGILLTALLAPAVAASAFPREIERENLDLLRGTLMSPWEVLRGKFLAAIYATSGVVAATGWGIGIAAASDRAFLARGVVAFAVVAASWVFVTAVATCASVLTKRTLAALVGSYVVLAAWFLAIPLVSGGLGASLTDLSVAAQPFSALRAACAGGPGTPLLSYFLFYAALTLAIWHISRLEVEILRSRDD